MNGRELYTSKKRRRVGGVNEKSFGRSFGWLAGWLASMEKGFIYNVVVVSCRFVHPYQTIIDPKQDFVSSLRER